jgi:peroxiredoxin Q/BCP
MTHLTAGMPAPQFEGTDQNGNTVKLSSFTGKKIVLYFYPKDNTPGCTAEACSLRDNHEDLIRKGFVVIGVSPDSEKSHKGFAGRYNLPFPLIADTDRKIMNAYGAYGEKVMYGKKVTGVIRTTFIIDEKGHIEKVINKVDTKEHASQIFKLYENV